MGRLLAYNALQESSEKSYKSLLRSPPKSDLDLKILHIQKHSNSFKTEKTSKTFFMLNNKQKTVTLG